MSERFPDAMQQESGRANSIMTDALYVSGTLIFFALMIAYGYGCRALGRESATNRADQ
jgi:hypothetical protein